MGCLRVGGVGEGRVGGVIGGMSKGGRVRVGGWEG